MKHSVQNALIPTLVMGLYEGFDYGPTPGTLRFDNSRQRGVVIWSVIFTTTMVARLMV